MSSIKTDFGKRFEILPPQQGNHRLGGVISYSPGVLPFTAFFLPETKFMREKKGNLKRSG